MHFRTSTGREQDPTGKPKGYADITCYYNGYDEESRLIKDNTHRIEFDTTLHILREHLPEKARVLDTAAGTGRYAFTLIGDGHSVYAMDLLEKHVGIMRGKASFLSSNMGISQGNACDPGRFNEGEFDAVLCMGPIYHLDNTGDKGQCLAECFRVLRAGGMLFLAYLNIRSLSRIEASPACFHGDEPDDIEGMVKTAGFTVSDHIAANGMAHKVPEFINSLDPKDYKAFLEFHLRTCRLRSSISETLHGLIVCAK